MPLPQKWSAKRKKPPAGFDVVEPILEALENELRDQVKDTNLNQRKNESLWPVHQINWQKTRYIYDMYYTHQRISKAVYQYCVQQKLVDAALMAKWKKPGYERLCSTYVINPNNYKFGTTSICRVPWKDRSEDLKHVADPTVGDGFGVDTCKEGRVHRSSHICFCSPSQTGCLGCASGPGQPRNILGNKYGQNLAAVQIAREERQKKQAEAAATTAEARKASGSNDENPTIDGDSDSEEMSQKEDSAKRASAAGKSQFVSCRASAIPLSDISSLPFRSQNLRNAELSFEDGRAECALEITFHPSRTASLSSCFLGRTRHFLLLLCKHASTAGGRSLLPPSSTISQSAWNNSVTRKSSSK